MQKHRWRSCIIQISQNRRRDTGFLSNDPGCVFNINLKVPKEWLATDTVTTENDPQLGPIENRGLLRRVKDEMAKIFTAAGQTLVFNNPAAAAKTRNGNFNLEFRDKFSLLTRMGLAIIEPNAAGWRRGSKGEVSISKLRGASAFDLATAGAHEAAHEFLDDFPGNLKGGHSDGIMAPLLNTSNFAGMRFTSEQAKYLSTLCK